MIAFVVGLCNGLELTMPRSAELCVFELARFGEVVSVNVSTETIGGIRLDAYNNDGDLMVSKHGAPEVGMELVMNTTGKLRLCFKGAGDSVMSYHLHDSQLRLLDENQVAGVATKTDNLMDTVKRLESMQSELSGRSKRQRHRKSVAFTRQVRSSPLGFPCRPCSVPLFYLLSPPH